MTLPGRISSYCLLFISIAVVPLALAETIRLKNGRVILADSVRESNGRIEYTIGEDTYAIPKASVVKIDTGGSGIVTKQGEITAPSPQDEIKISNAEELNARLFVN